MTSHILQICIECGSELYYEALVNPKEEVVTVYDESAICSNRECINGQEFHKSWHIELISKVQDLKELLSSCSWLKNNAL